MTIFSANPSLFCIPRLPLYKLLVVINYAKSIFTDFVSTLYPTNCLNCSDILVANEEYLCAHCRLDMPWTDFHLNPKNRLLARFSHLPEVKAAYAYIYFHRGGLAQKLLHDLKYKGNHELGQHLGRVYGAVLAEHDLHVDLILPVPIHPTKKKKRGYNQADHIARGLSTSLNISLSTTALVKKVENRSQTNKSKLQRWQNVESVFEVVLPEVVRGKRIMLVDDVITTGATMTSLCELLSLHGVEEIHVCAIATGVK